MRRPELSRRQSAGRWQRLRRRFPDIDLFGAGIHNDEQDHGENERREGETSSGGDRFRRRLPELIGPTCPEHEADTAAAAVIPASNQVSDVDCPRGSHPAFGSSTGTHRLANHRTATTIQMPRERPRALWRPAEGSSMPPSLWAHHLSGSRLRRRSSPGWCPALRTPAVPDQEVPGPIRRGPTPSRSGDRGEPLTFVRSLVPRTPGPFSENLRLAQPSVPTLVDGPAIFIDSSLDVSPRDTGMTGP